MVRVSAELEQEMIFLFELSTFFIGKRPVSRDVSATFGKMYRRRPHLVLKQTLHACPYQTNPPCMPVSNSMRLTEREYAIGF